MEKQPAGELHTAVYEMKAVISALCSCCENTHADTHTWNLRSWSIDLHTRSSFVTCPYWQTQRWWDIPNKWTEYSTVFSLHKLISQCLQCLCSLPCEAPTHWEKKKARRGHLSLSRPYRPPLAVYVSRLQMTADTFTTTWRRILHVTHWTHTLDTHTHTQRTSCLVIQHRQGIPGSGQEIEGYRNHCNRAQI